MRVDTDVLTWNLRGNARAADRLDGMSGFLVSAVTCMELVLGVRDKGESRALRRALNFGSARVVQVDEAISARACFLVEQFALSHSMKLSK